MPVLILSGYVLILPSFFKRASRPTRKASNATARLLCTTASLSSFCCFSKSALLSFFFFFCDLVDDAAGAENHRGRNVARFHVEGGAKLFSAAHPCNGSGAIDRVTGFRFQTQGFGYDV